MLTAQTIAMIMKTKVVEACRAKLAKSPRYFAWSLSVVMAVALRPSKSSNGRLKLCSSAHAIAEGTELSAIFGSALMAARIKWTAMKPIATQMRMKIASVTHLLGI